MKRVFFILMLFAAAACNDYIGDSCGYDADCSPNGDRNCDNGQPGGYCLIITCASETCPSEAACVEFLTPSPDFSVETDTEFYASKPLYETLNSNRARTYCLRHCKKNSTCRDGYHCAKGDELHLDLNAMIIDYNAADEGICVPGKAPKSTADSATDTDTDTSTVLDTSTSAVSDSDT